MSTTILIIGLLVFLAHFLSLQFKKTNIPDVLVLVLLGIFLGPVLGFVSQGDFGQVGSLFATIALVVILFEGGTTLDLDVLSRSLATTGKLALGGFVLTTAIVTLIGMYLLGLNLLPATLLGLTLGSTSPAVVIPIVNSLRLSEKPATVLVLESALTDVLSIIGVFALIQIHLHGEVAPGKLIGEVMSAMIFAAVIGVLGGLGWLLVLGKVRDFPNTISSTLAYVFIVYGLTEFLGFSGAIAALALGITLTNFEKFHLHSIPSIDRNIVPLNEIDKAFYSEAVFLLKTYFFIYLGISIQFGEISMTLVAFSMVLVIYAMRLSLTRLIFSDASYSLRDTAITSMMGPKGLASAVLATLPLKYGVDSGELIRDVAYMVVLLSISLTAVLVMLYPRNFAQRIYSHALKKPIDKQMQNR
ncbi:MAG: cation:proton antiporter [Gallionella sp.]